MRGIFYYPGIAFLAISTFLELPLEPDQIFSKNYPPFEFDRVTLLFNESRKYKVHKVNPIAIISSLLMVSLGNFAMEKSLSCFCNFSRYMGASVPYYYGYIRGYM